MSYKIRIPEEITVSRAQVVACLVLAAVCAVAKMTGAETLTLDTYYPAPVGIYDNMTVLGKTVLARDTGAVGVGTGNPQTQLDMTGLFRPGRYPADPPGVEGALYFNTTLRQFRGFKNGAWGSLGGFMIDTANCVWRPSGRQSLDGYTPGNDLIHSNNGLWYAATCAGDEVVWGFASHEYPGLNEHHQIYCCKIK